MALSTEILCGHKERKHFSKGKCASCYQMQHVSPTPVTACPHTDQPHRGRGMCRPCYMAWYWEARKRGPLKKPTLLVTACPHTDRRHFGKGLCRMCYTATWRKENPEKARAQTQATRMKQYGITVEEYEAMWRAQGGACANDGCGQSFPLDVPGNSRSDRVLHVDHDHTTGRVRGLLCYRCNYALGHADDDAIRLRGLIEYLTAKERD